MKLIVLFSLVGAVTCSCSSESTDPVSAGDAANYRNSHQLIMEKDILNYSPTVMFRGTPCNLD